LPAIDKTPIAQAANINQLKVASLHSEDDKTSTLTPTPAVKQRQLHNKSRHQDNFFAKPLQWRDEKSINSTTKKTA